MQLQSYDFNLANQNDVSYINVVGSFLYYLSSSAGVDDSAKIVLSNISGGGSVPLLPGQNIRLSGDQLSNQWVVRPAVGSAGTFSGVLLIGDGGFGDNRITGVVSTIDAVKTQARTGQAFNGRIQAVSIVAQYAHAQLFNAAASGKTVFVKRIGILNGATGAVGIFFYSGALGAPQNLNWNKLAGGPVGKAQFAASSQGALVTSNTGQTDMFYKSVANGGWETWEPSGPLVLPPGFGVVVRTETAATPLQISAEWTEDL